MKDTLLEDLGLGDLRPKFAELHKASPSELYSMDDACMLRLEKHAGTLGLTQQQQKALLRDLRRLWTCVQVFQGAHARQP